MKIYHICELCDAVFNTTEVKGAEGAVELKGVCAECSLEIGAESQQERLNNHFWYN